MANWKRRKPRTHRIETCPGGVKCFESDRVRGNHPMRVPVSARRRLMAVPEATRAA